MVCRSGLFAAALLAASACGTVVEAAAPEPLPVEEVAPGIFVYAAPYALAARDNEGAIANLGFIVGADSVAVIDTGNSRRVGRRLLAAIRERTDLPVAYVINTHMHPDHVLGNAAFLEEGADFVAHHRMPRALAARADAYAESGREALGEALFAGSEIVLPERLVEDRLELDLGGRLLELKAHATAHTDNDLTVFDAETGTWFLGDLLFMGHLPVIDGRLTGWLAFMDEAAERSAERVVPGHGPASAPWPEAMEPQRRYLARIESDVRALLDAGAGMAEASRNAGLSEADGWALFEAFNGRNAVTAYHELEWE